MNKQDYLIYDVNSEIRYMTKRTGEISNAYETYCGSIQLEDVFTTTSIQLCAKRCASGFMHKADTYHFMKNLWVNSKKLCDEVLAGTFKPKYRKKRIIIERGKEREIQPPYFDCKVVQKVICDYLIRPLLEPRMVETNYASVKYRGTDKMHADIEEKLKEILDESAESGMEYLIVMGDYSGYFGNIEICILMEMLGSLIKDKRILRLIHMFSPEEFGLSLGNEMSQVPASFFPSEFDHFCVDKKGWPYYRYMDDSLVIIPKEEKENYLQSYFSYAEKLHIKVKKEKIKIARLGYPFTFCKERYLWDKNKGTYYRLLNPKRRKTEERKIKKIDNQEELEKQYRSVRGSIASHPNTIKMLQKLDEKYKERQKDFASATSTTG